jgi:hypothetical protein
LPHGYAKVDEKLLLTTLAILMALTLLAGCATAAARTQPDLVIHVGDYHYRALSETAIRKNSYIKQGKFSCNMENVATERSNA